MKEFFITDCLNSKALNQKIILLGWIKNKRCHNNRLFIQLVDSSGEIQIIVEKELFSASIFDSLKKTKLESALKVTGVLKSSKMDSSSLEVCATNVETIAAATQDISPKVREDFDVFSPKYSNHLLKNRHFYIRNAKIMAVLKARHFLLGKVHDWFRSNHFTEITAPILTTLPLYEDSTVIPINLHDQELFLTQCAGFYLESAVHAFEKVYNLGPSFRAEESKSKRHLIEYWHIKAELAFVNREDLINIVESFIKDITLFCQAKLQDIAGVLNKQICTDGLKIPFPRIEYADAITKLQTLGYTIKYGSHIGSAEEEILSNQFGDTPFWIVGIPRSIEPFPYVIDSENSMATKTADLIASKGYGELLGVAEKIHECEMLKTRMLEKGKLSQAQYKWLLELREFGCVPHGGFGAGFERLLRWILQIEHVRDAIPFPRVFGRKVYP